MNKYNQIPILPLRDIVVFPKMVVPLFVGRKASIKALDEVMKRNKKILLLSQKNSIEFIVKNFTERTVSVTADNIEYRDIKSVKINSINENKCIVLFDSNHSMED